MSRPSPVHGTLPAGADSAPFVAHDLRFADVLGDAPRLERVASIDAHEPPGAPAAFLG